MRHNLHLLALSVGIQLQLCTAAARQPQLYVLPPNILKALVKRATTHAVTSTRRSNCFFEPAWPCACSSSLLFLHASHVNCTAHLEVDVSLFCNSCLRSASLASLYIRGYISMLHYGSHVGIYLQSCWHTSNYSTSNNRDTQMCVKHAYW